MYSRLRHELMLTTIASRVSKASLPPTRPTDTKRSFRPFCFLLSTSKVNQLTQRRTARQSLTSLRHRSKPPAFGNPRPFTTMNVIQALMFTGAAIGGSLLAALYVLQEKLLYHPTIPTRAYDKKPNDYGMDYIDVDLVTQDSVRIHAWLVKQERPKQAPTLVYFHGNAGNIAHRLPDVRQHYQSGFNVLMVSYRGYGSSDGFPTEKGMKMDAAAALEYIRDRNDIVDIERIYLFGRSIGGACAIALASMPGTRDAIRGVIVENTFTSTNDMIDTVLPALRFAKPFNRNNWNSLDAIKNVHVPIMIIRGLLDELVPPDHSMKLLAAASKARFTATHVVENGGHNDTWWQGGSAYRDAITEFLRRIERGD